DTSIEVLEDKHEKLTSLMSMGEVDPRDLPTGQMNLLFERMGKKKWEEAIERRVREAYGDRYESMSAGDIEKAKERIDRELRKSLTQEGKIDKAVQEIHSTTEVEDARWQFTRLAAQAQTVVENINEG